MKKAFTLLEIVIVIVIVGVLAYFGAELTVKIYNGYFHSRTINYLTTQTDLTLEIIAKRLENRIHQSVISRTSGTDFTHISFRPTSHTIANKDNILEWISYSYESFQNGGWSGFIDIDSPNTNKTARTISTPGSNLCCKTNTSELYNSAKYTMADLTDTNGKKIDFSSNYTVGMIFRSNEVTGNIKNSFGFDHSTFAADSVIKVKAKSDGSPVLEVDSADIGKVNKIYEQYYLAHTAYAIVPVNPKDGRSDTTPDDGRFDIYLHYNYRPWLGEKYNDTNTPKALLARGVKGFSYKALDSTIILQLCMTDIRLPINEASLEENIVCKRRAVL